MAKDRSARGARRAAQSPRRGRGRAPFVIAGALALAAVAGLVWAGSDAASAPSSPTPGVAQTGRVRGADAAPVTIEEYADFQCPACGQFARTTEQQLLQTYIANGQVRLVFRHFAFLGMESNWAAEAAECAGEQGRFWDMHDKLYASQAGENKGAFSKANLKKIGAELGLGASFATCVDSGRYSQAVRAASLEASDRGVRATPTLFIADKKVEGAATYEHLKTIIDAALGR